MHERPEQPIFGPETIKRDSPHPPKIETKRSIAKAISWRVVGTIDTLILSYLLITYLGPIFGLENSKGEALEAASYIALTEVVTKMVLYFFHERVWSNIDFGIVHGPRSEKPS